MELTKEQRIKSLEEEIHRLKTRARYNNLTKDDMIDIIKKKVGKKEFINGLFKFNSVELEDFLKFIELGKFAK